MKLVIGLESMIGRKEPEIFFLSVTLYWFMGKLLNSVSHPSMGII